MKREAIEQVLVAANDEDAVKVMTCLIADLYPHAEVLVARDGMQVIALALAKEPNIALIECELPKIDGVSAAACIRQGLGRTSPLLISFTSNPTIAITHGADSVFDYVLSKPINVPLLSRLIGQHGSAC